MKWLSLLLNLLPNLRGKAADVAKSEQVKEFSNRVLWEVVAIVISLAIGYLISHFSGKSDLRACQDEREVLLRQNSHHQAVLDSLHYSALLANQNNQLLQKDEEILLLSQRLRADSIAHLSELQAMRAINRIIKSSSARQP